MWHEQQQEIPRNKSLPEKVTCSWMKFVPVTFLLTEERLKSTKVVLCFEPAVQDKAVNPPCKRAVVRFHYLCLQICVCMKTSGAVRL